MLCLTSTKCFRTNHDNVTNSFPLLLALKVLLVLIITYQPLLRIFICRNTYYEIWKYLGLTDGDLGKVDSRHTAHLMSRFRLARVKIFWQFFQTTQVQTLSVTTMITMKDISCTFNRQFFQDLGQLEQTTAVIRYISIRPRNRTNPHYAAEFQGTQLCCLPANKLDSPLQDDTHYIYVTLPQLPANMYDIKDGN
jgi:hypothetical protein